MQATPNKALKTKKARRDAKNAKDEDAGPADRSVEVQQIDIAAHFKALAMDSCIVKAGGNIQNLLQKAPAEAAVQAFDRLQSRLVWYNSLGLGLPPTGEEAKEAWLAMKGLELDWGPKTSRRENRRTMRIIANLQKHVPQYIHLIFALMLIRSLGRWGLLAVTFVLQLASLMVPVELVPKVPAKTRVACALAMHALVWLLFLREVLWCTYFFEKIMVMGLLAFHAHSVRPDS